MESTQKSETKVVWKCRAEQLVAVFCILALAESMAQSRKQKWLWNARLTVRVRVAESERFES